MSKNIFNKEKIIVLSLLLFVFFLSFAYYFYYAQHKIISTDGILYLQIAKNISTGKIYAEVLNDQGMFFYYPLYSFFIYIFNIIISNWEMAAIFVSIVSYILLFLLIGKFSRLLFGSKYYIWTILALILYTTLLRWSSVVSTESFFTLLFIFVIYLCYNIITKKRPNIYLYLLLGFTCGLLFLTKAVGIIAFPVCLLWVVIIILIRKRELNKKSILLILLFCLGFLFTVIPYQVYSYKLTGKFILNSHQDGFLNHVSSQVNNNNTEHNVSIFSEQAKYQLKVQDGEQVYGYYGNEFNFKRLIFLFITPAYYKMVIINYYNILYVIISAYLLVLLPFMVISILFTNFIKKNKIQILYIFSWILIFVLFYAAVTDTISFNVHRRYMLPLIPLFILIAIPQSLEFFKSVSKKINFKYNEIIYSFLIFTLMLTLFINQGIPHIFPSVINLAIRSNKYNYQVVSFWIENNLKKDSIIMDRKPSYAYYSNNKFITVPYGSYEEVLAFATENNVDYFIVDKKWIHMRPQLDFLLNDQDGQNIEELVRLKSFDIDNNGESDTIIYKFIR